MGIMTQRNSRRGKLVLLLAALTAVAGSQPQSCSRVASTDEYIEQLRETVVNLDPNQVRSAAGQGDASAQTSLGLMYFHGEGVLEDMREAAKWFREAAEQGDAKAQYTLAHMYAFGKGVPEDGWEATKWFRLAAKQGHVEAQHRLGFAHWVGGYDPFGPSRAGHPPRDTGESKKWFQMAAKQGKVDFLMIVGAMYYEGEVVPEDVVEALTWFRMAAEHGEDVAQLYLCLIYFEGEKVPKDYTEAMKWFRMAAEQDPAGAPLSLGKGYESDEEGVPMDYVKAYAWYILATAQGSEEASELKDSLREKMTAEQLHEAQQLAAELEEHIEAARSD